MRKTKDCQQSVKIVDEKDKGIQIERMRRAKRGAREKEKKREAKKEVKSKEGRK